MTCDVSKYRPFLSDCDLNDADKDELIQTVYVMMTSFVEQAFGVYAPQLAREEFAKKASISEDHRDTLPSSKERRNLYRKSNSNGPKERIEP